MICSVCGVEVPDDDAFCEECGARLSSSGPGVPACACGSTEGLDDDGFCLGCGRRVLRPQSDHVEEELSPALAAVTDRGLVHERNEDRFALRQVGSARVLVVCDGVSASREAAQASRIAAQTLAEEIAKQLQEPEHHAEDVLRAAFALAIEELSRCGGKSGYADAPSTTAVVALVRGGTLSIAWVGDSRAYWISGDTAEQLTRDHSWLEEVVSKGELSLEVALGSPQAHAITRWLGEDAGPQSTPEFTERLLKQAGTLVLCSDGLWNYLPDVQKLEAEMQYAGDHEPTALELSQHLVEFANLRGGKDNVTVAVLRFKADSSSQDVEPEAQQERKSTQELE